jgi:prepilin-type N-terminal cleavage/methylation domain-containing protein
MTNLSCQIDKNKIMSNNFNKLKSCKAPCYPFALTLDCSKKHRARYHSRQACGFTIVELLVVIVVIGILAAITLITYTNITDRAKVASLQSDLNNASQQLKIYQVSHNDAYPASVTDCPNPSSANICLKSSNGATYTSYTPTLSGFTLVETASDKTTKWQVTDGGSPAQVAKGSLSVLSPSTVSNSGSTGFGGSLVVSPDGISVYSLNTQSNSVSMFSRNSETSQLTPLSPATVADPSNSPEGIVVSPDGSFVYVSNNQSGITMYSRDRTTGLLTPLSPATVVGISGQRASGGIAISPNGASVYLSVNGGGYGGADNSGPSIVTFSRNTNNGMLTQSSVLSLPIAVATDSNTQFEGTLIASMKVSPDGTSVYATNYNQMLFDVNGDSHYGSESVIYMFSRNSSGQLTALNPSVINCGDEVQGMVISPDGSFVYAINTGTDGIYMYSRNPSTGQLTALSPATVQGKYPYDIAISPDGSSVYTTDDRDNNVITYSRDKNTGKLSLVDSSTPTGGDPVAIVVSPDGLSVYAANYNDNNISMFVRNQ